MARWFVILLLGIAALAGSPSAAGATMLWGGRGTSITANSCSAGDFANGIGADGTLTCGTPSGDVSAIWTCASGNCDALTAAAGDSFNATSADSSIPVTATTSLPATCTEGQHHQDTNSGGVETYICTATNTWRKLPTQFVYDVRDYGAACDDSSDDAAEIQAAIDAAEATGQGGIVMLPAGICRVNSGLNMNEPGITLQGQGAATSNNATTLSCGITTGTCVTIDTSCTYCGIEDMEIATRAAPTDAVMVDATGASNPWVRDVNLVSQRYCTGFKNVWNLSRVSLQTPVAGASCRGISAVDTRLVASDVDGTLGTNIEGLIVIEQTLAGQVDTVVLNDVELAQSGGTGAALKITGTDATNPPRWIQISNSLFEAKTTGAAAGDYPIHLEFVRDFKCSTCYAQGGYNSVRIEGGPGPIVFTNSVIGNSMREAVYHDADVITSLVATTVSDAGLETDNTYSDVYLSANSRGFSMIGGTVGAELLGFPGNDPKYGIEVDASASEYRFSNVVCADPPDSGCASGLSPAAAQVAFTDATAYGDADWSNYVMLRAPATVGTNWTLTLPTTDGAANELLQTDGSGATTWVAATSFETALEGVLDHNDLQGLTTGDPHTQYALLAGRSGGQTQIGGTGSGDDYRLQSTSHGTKGTLFFDDQVDLFDSFPDITDGSDAYGLRWAPSFSVGGTIGTQSTVRGLYLNPTVNFDDATGVAVNTYRSINGGGTFTVSGAAFYAIVFEMFGANALLTSATASVNPPSSIVYRNQSRTLFSSGSGSATTGSVIGFSDEPIVENSGAATFTATEITGFKSVPAIRETAGTLNVGTYRGLHVPDLADNDTGTPAVTTAIGIDLAKQTLATANIGFRNAGSMVYTPTTQTIGADTDQIAPTASVVCLNSTANRDLSSNPQITDGQQGQELLVINCDSSTETIELNSGSGLVLAGATAFNMDAGDNIRFVYVTTAGSADWVEISRMED